MRNLIPILLAVVILSSGCDPDGYSCNTEGCYADADNPQYQTLEDCNNLCENPKPSKCGSPVLYDDYFYSTIQIGEQCWFAENLNTSKYNNGDDIPNIQDDGQWSDLNQDETGAWAYYNNDPDYSWGGNFWSPIYTKLYNWYAVNDSRSLCPSGWHVPSHDEWIVLTDLLGGSGVAGYSMKADYGWGGESSYQGSNSSGFSGLPGGYRTSDGDFNFWGSGYFWSSSNYNIQNYDVAWHHGLNIGNNFFDSYDYLQSSGMSVRCLRD